MKIKIFEFNPLAVNTYVLSDETNEAVVIDAAGFFPKEKELLINYILDNNLVVKHLLNTHLHFDHLFGVHSVSSTFNVSMEAHIADEFLLEKMPLQMQMFGLGSINEDIPVIGKYLKEGDTIVFGNQQLDIFEVPGHSPGSIAFYNKAENCVFSGDALFNMSIGRTDLEQGNYDQLIDSIRMKLFTLPPQTVVYPGHGPSTTVESEMMHNPFFQH